MDILVSKKNKPDREGNLYALVIVDAASTRMWAYPMAKKSSTLLRFQKWRQSMSSNSRFHAQPNRLNCTIRTDCDKEF